MDQHPENAATAGEVTDRAMRLLVDALREELLEQLAPLVEHSDRGVPGASELLRTSSSRSSTTSGSSSEISERPTSSSRRSRASSI